jgi:hypothetical protein
MSVCPTREATAGLRQGVPGPRCGSWGTSCCRTQMHATVYRSRNEVPQNSGSFPLFSKSPTELGRAVSVWLAGSGAVPVGEKQKPGTAGTGLGAELYFEFHCNYWGNQVTCHPDPARTVPVLPPCQVTREFIWDASDNRQLVHRARAFMTIFVFLRGTTSTYFIEIVWMVWKWITVVFWISWHCVFFVCLFVCLLNTAHKWRHFYKTPFRSGNDSEQNKETFDIWNFLCVLILVSCLFPSHFEPHSTSVWQRDGPATSHLRRPTYRWSLGYVTVTWALSFRFLVTSLGERWKGKSGLCSFTAVRWELVTWMEGI